MTHKPVILIVDDDASNLEVLVHILIPLYAVRVALSGALALQIAATAPLPDLILLDIGLLDMDGYAVLDQLKSSATTRNIPVIFVTARDTTEDEEHGFDCGAVDYITKPVRPPVVLARVHLHLSLLQAQRELADQNMRLEQTLAAKTAELEQSQRQIMQAEKMAAIGLLAGGIAHDFNNILSPIIGYTEMALEDVDHGHPLYKSLQHVYKAGLRARDLVSQILVFARKSEYEKKPVLVSLIVKDTLQLLRASLPSTIDIQSRFAPDAVNGAVLGEPTKIDQILMNICTNAAHAMKGKDGTLKVTLTTDVIEPDTALGQHVEPGPYLRLTIADNGHGMSSEIRQKIFDPYFTTKAQGEGTGLGLSVVYGIVQSLKGCIVVDSQPDIGTTFHIMLPLIADADCSLPIEHSPFPKPIRSGTVLLVDDEVALVDMVRSMLERLGHTVVACRKSPDALAAFQQEPGRFDLVVTDQTMPQMTGIQLAEDILRIRPDIPIILCSGFNELATLNHAKEIGIRGTLPKPFSIRQLADAIEACMASR